MKIFRLTAVMLIGAGLLGGCALGKELGWQHERAPATDVQVASCDAATATLKGKPDHGTANGACLDAKVRQKVD